jgi:opacity protein-like surface antigen
MRIKKLALSCLFCLPALFSATSAFAVSNSAPFDGFYVSGSVGGINSDYTVDQQPTVSIPGTIMILPKSSSSAYSNTVMGALGVGFNKTFCNRFLLGIEGVGDIENDASTNKIFRVREVMSNFLLANTTDTQLKNSFALLFTPGVLLNCNTLFYGLIGPRWGRFTTSEFVANSVMGGGGSVITTSAATGDHTEWKTGLTAGAGISYNLTCHLSLGAEYDYTYYGRLSNPRDLTAPITTIDGEFVGNLNSSTRVKIMTNTLMGTLTYRF